MHGFTNTTKSWDGVAAALDPSLDVVRVDLPGHGGAAAQRLGFEQAAAAIGDVGGEGVYVGYSMGGRLCLQLALDRPEIVEGLVLIGASPGLADGGERGARREADERLADGIERDGTEAFLERWLSHPLFATLEPTADELAARRRNPPLGLASALRLLGAGAQEPLWHRLNDLKMPVLLVAGGRDRKFREINARMLGAGLPKGRLETVEGAGHAVHLEDPAACASVINEFVHQLRSA